MQVVETVVRPARLAFMVSTQASARVLRRAFRLLGGRWGGMFDVLIRMDPAQGPDVFFAAVLRLADPDFILSLDPALDGCEWSGMVEGWDIQPFDVVRFRERMERGDDWEQHFSERPSRTGRRALVVDVDHQGVTWQEAARFGLPFSDTRARRANVGDPNAEAPVRHGAFGLVAQSSARRWALFGENNDADLAARFWCLRALGATPTWRSQGQFAGRRPPRFSGGGYIYARGASAAQVTNAARRWSRSGASFEPAPEDPSDVLSPTARQYFAAKVDATTAYGRQLRTSLPAPPVLGETMRRDLLGVAEYRILSPDPGNPDGVILTRDAASRALLRGDEGLPVRVTRGGFAEVRPIAQPALAVLPEITYSEAVSAPLEYGGYGVEPSDKGLYQQRSLQLAHGLRFLAWTVRQPASANLLTLFDEYHGAGRPSPGYRRAVTYADLESRLVSYLRRTRQSIRRTLREEAAAWLVTWINSLLERELLIGGYILACRSCALRDFYRAEQVGQDFECPRCGARAPVPAPLVRSFRLNEAFFQMRDHDGQVVTLLLAHLRDEARESFLYLPEAQLSGHGHTREADAVALVDGSLTLAEAKSNNSLSRAEVDWYRFAAGRTRARKLLLATTDRSRPMCRTLDCARCARQGKHHRDYAWDDGARARVTDTRSRLAALGVEVETACFNSLVSRHADWNEELAPFRR